MERRKDLDFAKGIGIVFMVLGHSFSGDNGSLILTYIYSFHMPLFFIIPGIIYGSKRQSNGTFSFYTTLKIKTRKLLIPYFSFATLTALALCIIGRKSVTEFGNYMQRIITLQGINAMWFIPCFLIVELIFLLLVNKFRLKYCYFFFIVIGIFAVFFPFIKQYFPMMQTIVIGLSLFSLGYLLEKVFSMKPKWLLFATTVVMHLVLALFNNRVDLAYGIYGNPLLYYINGLLGTYVFIHTYWYVSKLKISNIFTWLGENSLIVLCTSSLVIEILRLLDYKLFKSILPSLGYAEGIVLCIFVILIEFLIILVCNKYLWFLKGEKKAKTSH